MGAWWPADAVPGLALTKPITLRAGDGSIVAGRIAKPGPGLLPAGMAANATDAVSLGATPALRHQGVPAKGGAPATVFVVPTDRGPEAIACVGVATSRCEAVAATLRLRTAGALDVAPSQDYAAALGKLLRDQSARERADRRALARAATGAGAGPRRGIRRPRPGRAGGAGAPGCGPRWRAPQTTRWPARSPRSLAATGSSPRRPARRTPARYRAAGADTAPGARRPRARDQRAEAARLQRHGEVHEMPCAC